MIKGKTINLFLVMIILNVSVFADNLSRPKKSKQLIHKHGYWQGLEIVNQHIFDPQLAKAMVTFLKLNEAQTLVDFGCGMGNYVRSFLGADFSCEGYDGNPDTYQLTNGVADVLDLSNSFDLGKKFDWVICLEVGEHLPKIYEKVLLQNLDRHVGKGIILSWAIKGQGGFGHFNEQNNDYIKNEMKNLGYINDIEAENFLRRNSTLPWFKNTIMVFWKK